MLVKKLQFKGAIFYFYFLMHSSYFVKHSWNAVTSIKINNCFKKAKIVSEDPEQTSDPINVMIDNEIYDLNIDVQIYLIQILKWKNILN